MKHTKNMPMKGKIKYEKEKDIDDRNRRYNRLQNNAERARSPTDIRRDTGFYPRHLRNMRGRYAADLQYRQHEHRARHLGADDGHHQGKV